MHIPVTKIWNQIELSIMFVNVLYFTSLNIYMTHFEIAVISKKIIFY